MLVSDSGIDYRIIYKIKDEFTARFSDVYNGFSQPRRPPSLKEIVQEMFDLQAKSFVIENQILFVDKGYNIEYLIRMIEVLDNDVIDMVLSVITEDFLHFFVRDIVLYLEYNQIAYVEIDDLHNNMIYFRNAAITEVW